MRKKLCRAAACPRRVDRNALFCGVHLKQLTPTLLAPIADNREAPAKAGPAADRAVRGAVRKAVDHIAKIEGRAAELKRARNRGAVTPGQGGTNSTATFTQAQKLGGTARDDLDL